MAYSEAFAKAAERGLVPPNYVNMGLQTAKTRQKMFRHLMDQVINNEMIVVIVEWNGMIMVVSFNRENGHKKDGMIRPLKFL